MRFDPQEERACLIAAVREAQPVTIEELKEELNDTVRGALRGLTVHEYLLARMQMPLVFEETRKKALDRIENVKGETRQLFYDMLGDACMMAHAAEHERHDGPRNVPERTYTLLECSRCIAWSRMFEVCHVVYETRLVIESAADVGVLGEA